MPRGVQLTTLVDQLKAETGQSTLVSVGVDNLPALKQILRRNQIILYDDYDWPHLRTMPLKSLSAGQRWYDMPSDLNFERIEAVAVKYNGQPHPIERGISFEEYAQYDPTSDERSDPVLKWDMKDNSGTTQIEVWPLPASNDMTLMFRGIRDLNPLVDDDDTCDIDDLLIVLTSAAEILMRQKSADAQAKLALVQGRLARLKGRFTGGSSSVRLGGAPPGQRRPSGPIIRVS